MSEQILFSRLLKSLVFPIIKNIALRCKAKNYYPVSLFPVVNKTFENLVENCQRLRVVLDGNSQ